MKINFHIFNFDNTISVSYIRNFPFFCKIQQKRIKNDNVKFQYKEIKKHGKSIANSKIENISLFIMFR